MGEGREAKRRSGSHGERPSGLGDGSPKESNFIASPSASGRVVDRRRVHMCEVGHLQLKGLVGAKQVFSVSNLWKLLPYKGPK